mmetsp:Transcript_2801/g.4788  ORF Transcript_2801/g.4788 Transcript_2801/m.4788 type:complete len:115 (+) Transcript_2801:191-535(+)|eukprot:CAMPEP_0168622596 /NCGR_PEP_ID=MMETSP0449_2-20121227/8356_1 /TAXON_ID=1082188 /ORGANISM="Strombidium rassoulzadegani, Strain ras09" /LENGTH=114 /DNA_ID=CAMNT_0008663881 /DNA_START=95 /DNA_END=439 /DNA_ORIENTATION=-
MIDPIYCKERNNSDKRQKCMMQFCSECYHEYQKSGKFQCPDPWCLAKEWRVWNQEDFIRLNHKYWGDLRFNSISSSGIKCLNGRFYELDKGQLIGQILAQKRIKCQFKGCSTLI